jgi:hypothetical protein
LLALAGAMMLAAACCQAAPQGSAHDPVMQLLQDRGLVQPDGSLQVSAAVADPSLLGQVREKTTDLVMAAMNFIGVRYRRGGTTAESGFDCSGFTRYVFENSIGLVLPRRADEQARAAGLFKIGKEELKPGDLVFFNTLRHAFSHVGIYTSAMASSSIRRVPAVKSASKTCGSSTGPSASTARAGCRSRAQTIRPTRPLPEAASREN